MEELCYELRLKRECIVVDEDGEDDGHGLGLYPGTLVCTLEIKKISVYTSYLLVYMLFPIVLTMWEVISEEQKIIYKKRGEKRKSMTNQVLQKDKRE